MKIISKTFKLLTVFLLVLGVTGCSDDDDNNVSNPQSNTIVDVALANGFTSLAAALEATDLVTTLQGAGPFTVFAPTNEAFDDLLNATGLNLNSLTPEQEELVTNILLNHVIVGQEIPASTLISAGSGYASTASPGPVDGSTISLYYNVDNGVVELNGGSDVVDGIGADVTTPDVMASNGIIHIVDAVIGLPDIVDHALNNDNFTSLTGALGSENLVSALQADGPFTVFAPDNTAFGNFTNPNSNALSSILLNHVIDDFIVATDLVNAGAGYQKTLANGPTDLVDNDATNLSLYFNVGDDVVINGGPKVAATDIVGTNGVIHVVDAVIDIPTVVTFALADPNFSNLVAALSEADGSSANPMYIPTLQGDGPFTVFAPNNQAFADLLNGATVADLDDTLLNSVLAHHVSTAGNAVSGDLNPSGATTLPTLQGDDIIITLPSTNGAIADVEDGAGNTDVGIVAVDVQAGNGVIHVLNKVMLPSSN